MPPRAFAFGLALLLGTLAARHAAASVAADLSLERLILSAPAGDAPELDAIRAAQNRVRRPDATPEDYNRLGWSWIHQARSAQDDGAYRLALASADASDARFGVSPDALLLRGHALHNLHRFAEAEAVARRLVAERGESRDYALLSDALMERGDLDGAARATQEFVNRAPGLESYARVAHLRWLLGDGDGAIAAMTSAIRAGDPRSPEPMSWALSRLAQLHLHQGDATRALAAAEAALARRSGYQPALLAKARALLAADLPDAAVPILQTAAHATDLPEYQWWLAEALRATGDASAADAIEKQIVARGAQHDGRTTALFLATRGIMPEVAVKLAREEVALRGDVHSRDALAWALFRAGDLAEAQREAQAVLREHMRDARLLLHAGLIAAAHGEPTAPDLLREAHARSASLTPSERALLAVHFPQPSS